MRTLTMLLLFFSVSLLANTKEGVAIKIFPDRLIFPKSCEISAQPKSKEFSILLTCTNSKNGKYFFNFRLNNIELGEGENDVSIKEIQIKSYTRYELTDKGPDGDLRTSYHYCTQEVCLDLVADYDQSVVDSITSQLTE